MAEISFSYHSASIIIYPKFNAPKRAIQRKLKDLIWVDNKMFAGGWFDTMFNPCFVCFVKNLPIEKADLTDLTWLGCLGWRDFLDGWVQLSSRETLAMFPNSSETIPYHPCMDDLLTYNRGEKWATFKGEMAW